MKKTFTLSLGLGLSALLLVACNSPAPDAQPEPEQPAPPPAEEAAADPGLLPGMEENTEWSKWFNRNKSKSGKGDLEAIPFKQTCAKPVGIECVTAQGDKDSAETGDIYTCDLEKGGQCVTANQPEGKPCQFDYKIRVLCPVEQPTQEPEAEAPAG